MNSADEGRKIWALLIAALAVVTAITVGLSTNRSEPPAPEPPAVAVTLPAPLPPATGIDGVGIAPGVPPAEANPDGLPADPEQLPPDVQAQPDAGSPAVVVPQGEGVGGEVFVSSPAWKGNQRLSAGYRYSSGTLHGAWDVGIWRGTKLYAAKAGAIVGARDGVANHPAGAQYAISGSPSNWILLCSTVNGKPAVLYYQHLSPGLKVKRGQKVTTGQFIGKSGNTGNSTGDHLHISASYSPWACKNITQSRADSIRYRYLTVASSRLFAPSKFWAVPKAKPVLDASAVAAACRANTSAANLRYARKALGLRSTTDKCGPAFKKRYKTYQRSLGYRGKAADGIPGYSSLSTLGRTNGFKVVR